MGPNIPCMRNSDILADIKGKAIAFSQLCSRACFGHFNIQHPPSNYPKAIVIMRRPPRLLLIPAWPKNSNLTFPLAINFHHHHLDLEAAHAERVQPHTAERALDLQLLGGGMVVVSTSQKGDLNNVPNYIRGVKTSLRGVRVRGEGRNRKVESFSREASSLVQPSEDARTRRTTRGEVAVSAANAKASAIERTKNGLANSLVLGPGHVMQAPFGHWPLAGFGVVNISVPTSNLAVRYGTDVVIH